jgi:hypothetical protein
MLRTIIFVVVVGGFLGGCDGGGMPPVVSSGGIPLVGGRPQPVGGYLPGTVLDPEFMRSVRNGG